MCFVLVPLLDASGQMVAIARTISIAVELLGHCNQHSNAVGLGELSRFPMGRDAHEEAELLSVESPPGRMVERILCHGLSP
jgi:hypothetical protein